VLTKGVLIETRIMARLAEGEGRRNNDPVAAKLVFENFEPGKVGWKGHVCCPAQWAAWRGVEF
jgi:hypothetical protein